MTARTNKIPARAAVQLANGAVEAHGLPTYTQLADTLRLFYLARTLDARVEAGVEANKMLQVLEEKL